MSACQQAKRRRKQMANNYSHLPPRMRPYYKQRDAATAAARLQRLIQRERDRKARGGK